MSTLALASAGASPLHVNQIVAWMVGEIPEARLSQLVDQRGIASTPDDFCIKALRGAGAQRQLVEKIRKAHPATSLNDECTPKLERIGKLAQQQDYVEVERLLKELVQQDPANAAYHFALGAILRREEKWDEAFDEFSESARLMPDLSETHSRLAFLFFRSDDPENAIAEARTALSMDPGNAEGYKLLGLGFYGSGRYEAALHAFRNRWRVRRATRMCITTWAWHSAIKET